MSTVELDRQIEAEQSLATELQSYAGKWVAVWQHEVVASADSLEELREQIGSQEVEGVFQVPEGDPAACFF